MKLNDFILLRAIFNEPLHDAVLAKDQTAIETIVSERYSSDIETGFVSLEPIDTDLLHTEHTEQLKAEAMLNRMM